jgi:hypothetical protein
MDRHYIPVSDKKYVFKRAGGRCEYCKCPSNYTTEPFSIEHIQPVAKQGKQDLDNLAYACMGCNIIKYSKTVALDPVSQAIVPLYNPRIMAWNEHFLWDETFTYMVAKTAIGRATIIALKLNRSPVKNLRRALIAIDEHPPKAD